MDKTLNKVESLKKQVLNMERMLKASGLVYSNTFIYKGGSGEREVITWLNPCDQRTEIYKKARWYKAVFIIKDKLTSRGDEDLNAVFVLTYNELQNLQSRLLNELIR